MTIIKEQDIQSMAAEIAARCENVSHPQATGQRTIRKEYSKIISSWPKSKILSLTKALNAYSRLRWFGYELLFNHNSFSSLDDDEIQELGEGIDSWFTVDAFARIISGPAWLRGQISDETILSWAMSDNLWWRRAALVSTVALNKRSLGGYGDIERTIKICDLLVADKEDMVIKALSWALRELVFYDKEAVSKYLAKHESVLASRVLREVRNKIATGLKTPKGERKSRF